MRFAGRGCSSIWVRFGPNIFFFASYFQYNWECMIKESFRGMGGPQLKGNAQRKYRGLPKPEKIKNRVESARHEPSCTPRARAHATGGIQPS